MISTKHIKLHVFGTIFYIILVNYCQLDTFCSSNYTVIYTFVVSKYIKFDVFE